MTDFDTTVYLLAQVAVMAVVTYLIRMLPLALVNRRITNVTLKSFLFYTPYAVLGAMTFPAIFYCGGTAIAGLCGTVVGLILAFCNCGMITVSLSASAAVFIANFIIGKIG